MGKEKSLLVWLIDWLGNWLKLVGSVVVESQDDTKGLHWFENGKYYHCVFIHLLVSFTFKRKLKLKSLICLSTFNLIYYYYNILNYLRINFLSIKLSF